jgi:hypothetical protein
MLLTLPKALQFVGALDPTSPNNPKPDFDGNSGAFCPTPSMGGLAPKISKFILKCTSSLAG